MLILLALGVTLNANAQTVSITTEQNASNREAFAAEYLQKKLTNLGYTIVDKKGEYRISLSQAKDTTGLKKEGFTISSKGKKITVFTYKPKKGSARKMGHRQPYTKVIITNVGKAEAAAE